MAGAIGNITTGEHKLLSDRSPVQQQLLAAVHTLQGLFTPGSAIAPPASKPAAEVNQDGKCTTDAGAPLDPIDTDPSTMESQQSGGSVQRVPAVPGSSRYQDPRLQGSVQRVPAAHSSSRSKDPRLQPQRKVSVNAARKAKRMATPPPESVDDIIAELLTF
jgi:hypothetical protein